MIKWDEAHDEVRQAAFVDDFNSAHGELAKMVRVLVSLHELKNPG